MAKDKNINKKISVIRKKERKEKENKPNLPALPNK